MIRRLGLTLALLGSAPLAAPAAEGRSIGLIRDAEIEATLQSFTAPIAEAAGLGANSVRLYIVNDEQLNAFVAGGMNLFLNTGLLMRSEEPSQAIGVIAHEVGHIAGGHLSRVGPAQSKAAAEMILATVLGAAAAVAGAPALGSAIFAGGQTFAQQGLMRFSQSQEQNADQAALSYLDQAGIPARGLAEFFQILDNRNLLSVSSAANPFLQSHPLTRERMKFVERYAAGQSGLQVPEAWVAAHARMVAKLRAFLHEPPEVLQTYEGDETLVGRYARAIAHYRMPDLPRALAEIDALIAERPDDPYFRELKGQMLFENGRVDEAVAPYREAVRLAPEAPLLRIGLAQALIETEQPGAVAEAIERLKEALQREPENPSAWRLLGTAQGRDGQEARSDVAFAEYALLIGKTDDARFYARRAESKIAANDPDWLRLQDILRVLEES
jgi:predicted Zn-dependent protease